MNFRLVQLAPGSYDVELDGEVIASLVQSVTSRRWSVELLDEASRRPVPFTKPVHYFDTFSGAQVWLGNPETVHAPGGDFARRTILSDR